jgi:CubicO group peptidase (beta-lactamase class C family)
LTRNIAAFVTTVGVIIIFVITAFFIDWRFWYRWHTLPEDAGEWPASYYQPISEVTGNKQAFFPVADPSGGSIETEALNAAAVWAEAHNSAALIVLHRGVVQLERYWQDIAADSLFSGRAMTRSLIPPLFAIAIHEGAIDSVDDPVGRYLPEWRDDLRGQITIRNLLHNLSGLENPMLAGDPDPDNKNSRLALGGDFRAAALRFDLTNQPGEFFALSNANAQLLGAVLESATGEGYVSYLNSRLWEPLGASPSYLYMDSSNGMPAVYCCFRATPRDWLRYGAALLNDGQVAEKQLWPKGWVDEMTTASQFSPNYGYQIWVGNPDPELGRVYVQGRDMIAPHGEPIASDGVFFLEGGGFRTMYVLPEQELVILRLGYYDANWKTSTLPNLILPGIRKINNAADLLETPK